MPPKLEPDESMKFLYTCFKCSDYNNIDWNAVGAANNLKSNAARMRFTRLRNAIEGTDGGGTDANPCVTSEGDSAETPTDTPTNKKAPKTPKKTPAKKNAKKNANNESPTKETPTKRKKKDESDDKPVKKAKTAKAKTVKVETEDGEGVDAGVDAAVDVGDGVGFHEAHQAIDEVEVAHNGAMIEA